MNVKRSLMVLSISLILLVSVSFVSAGFWNWLTGDATGTTDSASIRTTSITETVRLGKTAELSQDTSLTVIEVNEELGTVTATITNTKTGVQEQISLQKDGIAQLNDGTKLIVSDVNEGGFFTKDKVTFDVFSPSDGFVGEGEFAGETGFAGASICESLIEEEVILGPGDVGDKGAFLNGRFVELDEDGFLTIDGTYSYPLEKGDYFVPIPVQACYWEASYDGSKLDMFTVCPPVAEEFVEEEPVV